MYAAIILLHEHMYGTLQIIILGSTLYFVLAICYAVLCRHACSVDNMFSHFTYSYMLYIDRQSNTATEVCTCDSSSGTFMYFGIHAGVHDICKTTYLLHRSITPASAQDITIGVTSVFTLVLVVIACFAFILGWWLGRKKMKKEMDRGNSLQSHPEGVAYDVPSSTMQANPAYMAVEHV